MKDGDVDLKYLGVENLLSSWGLGTILPTGTPRSGGERKYVGG